jgi:hypothetical protein
MFLNKQKKSEKPEFFKGLGIMIKIFQFSKRFVSAKKLLMSRVFKTWIFFLPIVILLTSQNKAFTQVRPNLGNSTRLMNSALAEMEKGDFEKANAFFRQIIENGLAIPPEMPYFFAETLFELGQFHNSSAFLNKYLEINGYRGDNYEKAKNLEADLQVHLAAIEECRLCDRRGYRYEYCPTCYGDRQIQQNCSLCRQIGIVGCNKCLGSGIVKIRNVFNIVEYHDCDKCQGKGKITCPKCEGSLVEKSDCRTCKGEGRLVTEELCNHQPSNNPRYFNGFEKLRNSIDH